MSPPLSLSRPAFPDVDGHTSKERRGGEGRGVGVCDKQSMRNEKQRSEGEIERTAKSCIVFFSITLTPFQPFPAIRTLRK